MNVYERKDLLKLAAPLAAANPAAFKTSEDARRTLTGLWDDMKILKNESVATGGVLLRRDGDDGLEVWVTPTILGWAKKGS